MSTTINNKDSNLIAEAYFTASNKATTMKGMPHYDRPTNAPDLGSNYDAIQNTIDSELAAKPSTTVKDTTWAKDYVPYGPYSIKKYQVGVDGDKGEFVLWKSSNEGEMTYYYYLVYKNEGKLHDIDEKQYEHLSDLASA